MPASQFPTSDQKTFLSDPTDASSRQVLREISSLEKLVTQRMDGIERAVEVAHNNLTRVPTDVDKAIGHLREVLEGKMETIIEKFIGVQKQFEERDVRVEQTARDTKVAVDAALMAAEKAVGKQTESFAQSIAKAETATTKQIDQLGTIINTATAALADKIDDVKARLTRIEGQDLGQKAAKTTQETSNMNIVSVIGLVLGTIIGIGGLVVGFLSRG